MNNEINTTIRTDETTDSIEVVTNAKQMTIYVNGVAIDINAFKEHDVKITTYYVKKVTLNTSIDTQTEIKRYDEIEHSSSDNCSKCNEHFTDCDCENTFLNEKLRNPKGDN